MNQSKIKPIHPFGPPVGQWKPGANVAETFKRVLEQQAQKKQ
jgi:hypothetical protein